MKRILPFITLCICLAVQTAAQIPGTWNLAGKAGFTTGTIYFPSLSVDKAGTVYMAYTDSSTGRANVRKLVGASWSAAGNTNLSAGGAAFTALTLGKKDTPYVAYADGTATLKGALTVKKLSGATWVGVGQPFFTLTPALYSSIASDSTGTIYVAYLDALTRKVNVKKFNGSTWVNVGTGGQFLSGNYALGIPNLSMTVTPGGVPYVAFIDSANSNKVTVKKFAANAWSTVGTAGFTPLTAVSPSVAVEGAGVVYTTFSYPAQGYASAAMAYNGAAWLPMGAAGIAAGPAVTPRIAVSAAGVPYISFIDGAAGGHASVVKFTNNAWAYVAAWPGFSPGIATQLAIGLSSSGAPYVAFRDSANANKATVMRYDPLDSSIKNNIISGDKVICGTSGTVSIVTGQQPYGGVGTYAYKWQTSTDNKTFTYITGKTGISLTYSPALAITQTTYFRRIVVSGPKTIGSNVVTVTITPKLAPSISIVSNAAATNCAGTKITFTATAVNPGTNAVYQWKRNNVNVGTNSTVYTDSTFDDKDSVICVLTVSQACITPVTKNSNKLRIKIAPTVTPTITVSSSVGTTICAGRKVYFNAVVTNQGTAPAYQWQKNGLNVGTSSVNYADSLLNNKDTVSCLLTTNVACPSTKTVVSKLGMTVNPILVPAISITASKTTICKGTEVTFTAKADSAGATPAFQWKKNNVAVGTNSNVYTDATLKDQDSVICIITATAPCATPVTRNSNVIKITVPVTINPSVSITASSGTVICAGAKNNFKATAVDAGATPAYQWKKNGVNVGTNSTTYADSTLQNNDTISCTVTVSGTCATAFTVTAKLGITVNPRLTPTVSITSNLLKICSGVPVTFTATAAGTGASPVYQWLKNEVPVGTNSAVYTDAGLNNNDIVYCKLTVTAPCASPAITQSNKIQVKVNPGPATPSAITGSGSVTANQVGITYTVTNVSTAVYAWVVPAGVTIVSGQGTHTIKVNWGAAPGTVSVTAHDTCHTSAASTLAVTIAGGFTAGHNGKSTTGTDVNYVRVYPNPAADVVKLIVAANTNSKYQVQVTDAAGRILQTKAGELFTGTNFIQVNISRLAQGIYYVRLIDKEHGLRITKLVKQNNAQAQ